MAGQEALAAAERELSGSICRARLQGALTAAAPMRERFEHRYTAIHSALAAVQAVRAKESSLIAQSHLAASWPPRPASMDGQGDLPGVIDPAAGREGPLEPRTAAAPEAPLAGSAAAAGAAAFTLRVRPARAGLEHALSASPGDTVGGLKAAIAGVLGTPAARQRLIWRGRILPDHETLAQCGECPREGVVWPHPALDWAGC